MTGPDTKPPTPSRGAGGGIVETSRVEDEASPTVPPARSSASNGARARTGDASSSNRLPVLAGGIAEAHTNAKRAGREFVRWAIEAGKHLAEAKALLSHGAWGSWLSEYVPNLNERTARRYMRAAAAAGSKTDTVSVLSLRHLLAPVRDVVSKAVALRGRVELLRDELRELESALDTAGLDEVRGIRDRCGDIETELASIRLRSERELGRLAVERRWGRE